jgi:hypothetical protein
MGDKLDEREYRIIRELKAGKFRGLDDDSTTLVNRLKRFLTSTLCISSASSAVFVVVPSSHQASKVRFFNLGFVDRSERK